MFRLTAFVTVLALLASTAQAVTIETVPVGDPGNAGELSGEGAGGSGPDRISGAVDYVYMIGKYEVTAGQYTEFLNAVADEDTYGLYNPLMYTNAWGCKIRRTGAPGSYEYLVDADGDGNEDAEWVNRPVNYVSWGDAGRFANWLHNGQPTDAQGPSTTEDGSYFMNGATSNADLLAVTRKPGATWAIPSEDEWYKAAYYDPDKLGGAGYWDYPTQSDTAPTAEAPAGTDLVHGSANYYDGGYVDPIHYSTEVGAYDAMDLGEYVSDSAYGTFDQGGNMWEWNEAILFDARGLRGASAGDVASWMIASTRFYESGINATLEGYGGGLRVVVPEPSTLALLAMGAVGLLAYVWRRRRAF